MMSGINSTQHSINLLWHAMQMLIITLAQPQKC